MYSSLTVSKRRVLNPVRRAECAGVSKKPAIAIGNDWSIWIGNLTDTPLDLKPSELFGFGRGVYEEKIVSDRLSQMSFWQSVTSSLMLMRAWFVGVPVAT